MWQILRRILRALLEFPGPTLDQCPRFLRPGERCIAPRGHSGECYAVPAKPPEHSQDG